MHRDQGIFWEIIRGIFIIEHIFLALKDLKTFVNHSDIVIIAYTYTYIC